MQFTAPAPLSQPLFDLSNSYENSTQEMIQEMAGSNDGRVYAIVKDHSFLIVSRINSLVVGVFTVLGKLIGDTNTLASVFRKLDRHVLKGIEHLMSAPGYLSVLAKSMKHAVGLIDTVQVFSDLDNFYNCKYKNDKIFAYFSKLTVTVADAGGALLWFEEMSFIHLSSIAQTMAEIRVFKFVPNAVASVTSLAHVGPLSSLNSLAAKIGDIRIFSFMMKTSMAFIATRALTLTYIFLTIDAIQRLMNPGTQVQKIQASLDLSVYLSELVLDALMTMKVANLYFMGVAGGTAIALVIASFAYRIFHADELKQAELIKINETTQKSCAIT